jgi:hypothetical protein
LVKKVTTTPLSQPGLANFVYTSRSHLLALHHYMCKVLDAQSLAQMQEHADKTQMAHASVIKTASLYQKEIVENVTVHVFNHHFADLVNTFAIGSVTQPNMAPTTELEVLRVGLHFFSHILDLSDSTRLNIPFYDVVAALQESLEWIFDVSDALKNGVKTQGGESPMQHLVFKNIMKLLKAVPANFDFGSLAAEIMSENTSASAKGRTNTGTTVNVGVEESESVMDGITISATATVRRTAAQGTTASSALNSKAYGDPSMLLLLFQSSFLKLVGDVGLFTKKLLDRRFSEVQRCNESLEHMLTSLFEDTAAASSSASSKKKLKPTSSGSSDGRGGSSVLALAFEDGSALETLQQGIRRALQVQETSKISMPMLDEAQKVLSDLKAWIERTSAVMLHASWGEIGTVRHARDLVAADSSTSTSDSRVTTYGVLQDYTSRLREADKMRPARAKCQVRCLPMQIHRSVIEVHGYLSDLSLKSLDFVRRHGSESGVGEQNAVPTMQSSSLLLKGEGSSNVAGGTASHARDNASTAALRARRVIHKEACLLLQEWDNLLTYLAKSNHGLHPNVRMTQSKTLRTTDEIQYACPQKIMWNVPTLLGCNRDDMLGTILNVQYKQVAAPLHFEWSRLSLALLVWKCEVNNQLRPIVSTATISTSSSVGNDSDINASEHGASPTEGMEGPQQLTLAYFEKLQKGLRDIQGSIITLENQAALQANWQTAHVTAASALGQFGSASKEGDTAVTEITKIWMGRVGAETRMLADYAQSAKALCAKSEQSLASRNEVAIRAVQDEAIAINFSLPKSEEIRSILQILRWCHSCKVLMPRTEWQRCMRYATTNGEDDADGHHGAVAASFATESTVTVVKIEGVQVKVEGVQALGKASTGLSFDPPSFDAIEQCIKSWNAGLFQNAQHLFPLLVLPGAATHQATTLPNVGTAASEQLTSPSGRRVSRPAQRFNPDLPPQESQLVPALVAPPSPSVPSSSLSLLSAAKDRALAEKKALLLSSSPSMLRWPPADRATVLLQYLEAVVADGKAWVKRFEACVETRRGGGDANGRGVAFDARFSPKATFRTVQDLLNATVLTKVDLSEKAQVLRRLLQNTAAWNRKTLVTLQQLLPALKSSEPEAWEQCQETLRECLKSVPEDKVVDRSLVKLTKAGQDVLAWTLYSRELLYGTSPTSNAPFAAAERHIKNEDLEGLAGNRSSGSSSSSHKPPPRKRKPLVRQGLGLMFEGKTLVYNFFRQLEDKRVEYATMQPVDGSVSAGEGHHDDVPTRAELRDLLQDVVERGRPGAAPVPQIPIKPLDLYMFTLTREPSYETFKWHLFPVLVQLRSALAQALAWRKKMLALLDLAYPADIAPKEFWIRATGLLDELRLGVGSSGSSGSSGTVAVAGKHIFRIPEVEHLESHEAAIEKALSSHDGEGTETGLGVAKKKKKNNFDPSQTGVICWAQYRSYPPWPAQVLGCALPGSNAKEMFRVRLLGFGPDWDTMADVLHDRCDGLPPAAGEGAGRHYLHTVLERSQLSSWKKGKFPLGVDLLPRERTFRKAYRTAMAAFTHLTNLLLREKKNVPLPDGDGGDDSGDDDLEYLPKRGGAHKKRASVARLSAADMCSGVVCADIEKLARTFADDTLVAGSSAGAGTSAGKGTKSEGAKSKAPSNDSKGGKTKEKGSHKTHVCKKTSTSSSNDGKRDKTKEKDRHLKRELPLSGTTASSSKSGHASSVSTEPRGSGGGGGSSATDNKHKKPKWSGGGGGISKDGKVPPSPRGGGSSGGDGGRNTNSSNNKGSINNSSSPKKSKTVSTAASLPAHKIEHLDTCPQQIRANSRKRFSNMLQTYCHKMETIAADAKKTPEEKKLAAVASNGSGGSDGGTGVPSDFNGPMLAHDLEACIHRLFPLPESLERYNDKCRTVFINLDPARNQKLFRQFVSRVVSVLQLCRMSTSDMASDQQKAWREAKEREQLVEDVLAGDGSLVDDIITADKSLAAIKEEVAQKLASAPEQPQQPSLSVLAPPMLSSSQEGGLKRHAAGKDDGGGKDSGGGGGGGDNPHPTEKTDSDMPPRKVPRVDTVAVIPEEFIPKVKIQAPPEATPVPVTLSKKRKMDDVYEYNASSDSEDDIRRGGSVGTRRSRFAASSKVAARPPSPPSAEEKPLLWSGTLHLNAEKMLAHSCEGYALFPEEAAAVERVLERNSSLRIRGFLKQVSTLENYLPSILHSKKQLLLLRFGKAYNETPRSAEFWRKLVDYGKGRMAIVELKHIEGGNMYILPPMDLVKARFPHLPIVKHFDQQGAGFEGDVAYGLAYWKVKSKVPNSNPRHRSRDILCLKSTARIQELDDATTRGVVAPFPAYAPSSAKNEGKPGGKTSTSSSSARRAVRFGGDDTTTTRTVRFGRDSYSHGRSQSGSAGAGAGTTHIRQLQKRPRDPREQSAEARRGSGHASSGNRGDFGAPRVVAQPQAPPPPKGWGKEIEGASKWATSLKTQSAASSQWQQQRGSERGGDERGNECELGQGAEDAGNGFLSLPLSLSLRTHD